MTEKRDYPIKFKKMYMQVRVQDLERAKKFYEDIFNFEVSWYMSPEAGWCEFNLPGGDPKLGLNLAGEDEKVTPNWGILTMDVEDIEATKKYIESKGIETTDITDIPDMVSYFNMKDSEGNSIQIVTEPRVTSNN